jgi:hypothetical protein
VNKASTAREDFVYIHGICRCANRTVVVPRVVWRKPSIARDLSNKLEATLSHRLPRSCAPCRVYSPVARRWATLPPRGLARKPPRTSPEQCGCEAGKYGRRRHLVLVIQYDDWRKRQQAQAAARGTRPAGMAALQDVFP